MQLIKEMILDRYDNKPYGAILLLIISYMLVAAYFIWFLQFNFLKGDVLDYWKDSLAWQTPYHPFHVPIYPLAIAFVRGVTFGIFSPVVIMIGINFSSFLAGAVFVYRIILVGGAKSEYAALGTLLFGMWPFVGLTYAVNPQADLPAIALFLGGLSFLQRSDRLRAAIFLGLAIVTHKAMWPFIALLVAADCVYRKEYLSVQNAVLMAVMICPLGLLWFAGSFHHHSYTWLWDSNLQNELASASSNRLPLLDGLLGPFLFEGAKGAMKGLLLLGFVALALVSCLLSIKLKGQGGLYGGAIAVAVLILFIVLNHFEIWAAARFSRLLVVPLMLGASKIDRDNSINRYLGLSATLLLLFFLSQFAYAWYMARIFLEL